MTDVLLVTFAGMPEGEPGGKLIVEELATRGLTSAWAVWDDPAVDWAGARLVAVRSTWDYEWRREEFLSWAREVSQVARLVNTPGVLEWNTDKRYLVSLLDAGLPVVPTLVAEDDVELRLAVAAFDPAVVKPRVGAGGRGVVVLDGARPLRDRDERVGEGPWVVQPLVPSVRTEGETSVFVLGGRAVSMVRKLPAGEEIRVHEEYGGRTDAVALTEDAADLARRTVAVAEEVVGTPLPYARVDMMRLADGALAVSEVEAAEPGLYLDVVPENAGAFADAVVGVLET
jgi:glutathione synthase/RimK-type ligase-like ATP-grasp enzyme